MIIWSTISWYLCSIESNKYHIVRPRTVAPLQKSLVRESNQSMAKISRPSGTNLAREVNRTYQRFTGEIAGRPIYDLLVPVINFQSRPSANLNWYIHQEICTALMLGLPDFRELSKSGAASQRVLIEVHLVVWACSSTGIILFLF